MWAKGDPADVGPLLMVIQGVRGMNIRRKVQRPAAIQEPAHDLLSVAVHVARLLSPERMFDCPIPMATVSCNTRPVESPRFRLFLGRLWASFGPPGGEG